VFEKTVDVYFNPVFNGVQRAGSVVSTGISHRANGVEMQKQNITVKLEAITPVFWGGAEPRDGRLELRPPAFRGEMRYWLRMEVLP
jgi:hypothetical protein